MTYRTLDGSQMSDEECICRGAWSLDCPVDTHRARWLQSHQDWSDVETPSQPAADVSVQQFKPASLFGDDDDEEMEELQMGKANGFLDRRMLIDVLRRRIGKRFPKDVAPELGVSYQFIYKVLAGTHDPGPTLARSLGYEQFSGYRRIKPLKKKRDRKPKGKPAASKPQPHA